MEGRLNRAPKRYKGSKGPMQAMGSHMPAIALEGQAQQDRRDAQWQQSLSTAAFRRLPSARDAVEIQAYILRREGYHYADIARFLEVGHALARTLVTEGARACVDEDPATSLRLHLGRLEAMLAEWLPQAFAAPVSAEEIARAQVLGLPDPVRVARDEAAQHLGRALKILAMQQDLGTWLAGLPRRGQEVKDEDDHAEIKAILMRAEEYGPPPGQGGAPHGMPSLADWRPADVGDEDGEHNFRG